MKKYLVILAAAAMMASCSITKHSVNVLDVTNPIVTTTVASLEVEKTPITYVYTPSKRECKALSFRELLNNAQYLALKEHKRGDLLVQVSYSIKAKRVAGILFVKEITISGYPATYKDFRNPTEEDRKNIDAFYGIDTKIVNPSMGNIVRAKRNK